MDLNAGTIMDGTETIQEVGMRLFEKIISVANGKKPRVNSMALAMRNFSVVPEHNIDHITEVRVGWAVSQ